MAEPSPALSAARRRSLVVRWCIRGARALETPRQRYALPNDQCSQEGVSLNGRGQDRSTGVGRHSGRGSSQRGGCNLPADARQATLKQRQQKTRTQSSRPARGRPGRSSVGLREARGERFAIIGCAFRVSAGGVGLRVGSPASTIARSSDGSVLGGNASPT